jgi:peptide/nickel transport system substrate-binding protein
MIFHYMIAAALLLVASAGKSFANRDLFVVDLVNNPASLDPQMQWDPDSYFVYRNLFDNLVTRDGSGKIVPQVATAWSYQSDTQIVFTVRDGIQFEDGSRLTSDDVVFTIKRITDPAFKSPQLSQFDSIADAEAVGRDQVRLTTKRPYPILLSQLAKLSILPRVMVEKLGNDGFNEHPAGSGPYRLVSFTRGVKVELIANSSYWRAPPPFPRVEMRPVPNEETRIADVRTARADIVRVTLTDTADSLKGNAQVKVLFSPVERAAMLMLNALTGPTKDVRVRRAIAHAIDRNLIVEALLKGYARVINEPMTPANFGWVDGAKSYDYDPAVAKALLKDAGIPPGTKITFPTGPFFDQRVVQAIQQMLADVGLDAQISMSDGPTYLRLRQGRPDEAGDVSFFRWSCGCQDADGVLFPLFHSSSQWAKYSNPSVDAGLEAARNSLDPAKRLALYRQVMETLHTDVPAVPLYQDVMMFAARKEVQFQPTPNEAFFLIDMGWSQ